jgi:large subunit ribosomal protein L24
VDPTSNEVTRVGRKMDDNGNVVRYAKKSGEVLS